MDGAIFASIGFATAGFESAALTGAVGGATLIACAGVFGIGAFLAGVGTGAVVFATGADLLGCAGEAVVLAFGAD